jgi:hypothetical protein
MARARIPLPDPPSTRSHSERMAAARGIRLHGDTMRMSVADRRRIAAYRNEYVRVLRDWSTEDEGHPNGNS